MRELRRPRVILPSLAADGRGGEAAARHRDRKADDPSAHLDFPAHWSRPDVRGALYAMQGRICAYCQCELTRGDPGEVDHFRPKSAVADSKHAGYWWLAYEFTNYLLSCGTCNGGSVKGSRFPLAPDATRTEYSSRDRIAEEERLLCDPTEDPVETWLRVDWIDDLCDVKLRPTLEENPQGFARACCTVEFFQLNTDPRLKQERIRLLNQASKLHKEGQIESLRQLASRFRPHGIAVRNFLEDCQPELLPTSEEELDWLLDVFFAELEGAQRTLRDAPSNQKACLKLINEVCWALAVLWCCSPAGSAAEIEHRLIEAGWRDVICPLYDQLRRR